MLTEGRRAKFEIIEGSVKIIGLYKLKDGNFLPSKSNLSRIKSSCEIFETDHLFLSCSPSANLRQQRRTFKAKESAKSSLELLPLVSSVNIMLAKSQKFEGVEPTLTACRQKEINDLKSKYETEISVLKQCISEQNDDNKLKAEISDLKSLINERDQLLKTSREEFTSMIYKTLILAVEKLNPPHVHAFTGEKSIQQYKSKCTRIFGEISSEIGLNLPGQELLTITDKLYEASKKIAPKKPVPSFTVAASNQFKITDMKLHGNNKPITIIN